MKKQAITFIKKQLNRNKNVKKIVIKFYEITQRGVWIALDSWESLAGRKNPLNPPRRLMSVGSNEFTRGDFNSIGLKLFSYLCDVGGLNPNDKVLDVGCGVGRMAIPMTQYLSSRGTYDGIDIVAESIRHCKKAYSPRFYNFHFHHADAFNSHYNPDGKYLPHEYKFPFQENSFSFIFLTSVFTHMLGQGIENYLKEIKRVLRPGERCLITYFILNDESEALMNTDKSHLKFVYPIDHGKSIQLIEPEVAIAFDEKYIRDIYQKLGLKIVEPIRYGSWSGSKSEVGYQDIIVAVNAG